MNLVVRLDKMIKVVEGHERAVEDQEKVVDEVHKLFCGLEE